MEFMTLTEKVAYLKGLAEGMELDVNVAQNKLMLKIIEVLEDVAVNIEDLDDEQTAMIEEMEAISDDLADVEEAVFDECEDEDEDYDWDGEDVYDIECPNCGEKITIDAETLDKGGMNCPNCGEKLEFEICDDDEDDDCDCDCGCTR